ncbi:matrilin-4 [Tachyglossus aculeatus]|uniref:matrilin-4 n=1 Tax=Tachyglossus aculeatus TaxID=9261 RepID=UPI0018F32537|nr:matrilin-4 [Tachyglossus aculeatus]
MGLLPCSPLPLLSLFITVLAALDDRPQPAAQRAAEVSSHPEHYYYCDYYCYVLNNEYPQSSHPEHYYYCYYYCYVLNNEYPQSSHPEHYYYCYYYCYALNNEYPQSGHPEHYYYYYYYCYSSHPEHYYYCYYYCYTLNNEYPQSSHPEHYYYYYYYCYSSHPEHYYYCYYYCYALNNEYPQSGHPEHYYYYYYYCYSSHPEHYYYCYYYCYALNNEYPQSSHPEHYYYCYYYCYALNNEHPQSGHPEHCYYYYYYCYALNNEYPQSSHPEYYYYCYYYCYALNNEYPPSGGRCRTGAVDLVFLVDSSRSVRPREFEAVRGFLLAVLRGLDVGPDATRVGLVQYSSRLQPIFPLAASARPLADLERAVGAMVPLARGTMTGLALQYAVDVAFTGPEGARPPQARVPRVAVVVTDGRPQDRVDEVASRARARGIEIYAVGVRRADVDSLRAMASPPLDGHVFLVDSFDLLPQAGLQFRGLLCAQDLCNGVDHGCEFECVSVGSSYHCACPEGSRLQPDQKSCGRCAAGPLDLVLLVDGSKSVGGRQLELVKRWAAGLVDLLDVSPAGTRVGLLQFSSRARTEFPLGRYGTAGEVKAAILALAPMGQGTRTGLALRHLVERSFTEAEGARPGSRRVGLLLTDGRSQDAVSPWAAWAKDQGIVLFAVGVGKAVEEELREIASEPVEQHVLRTVDFGTRERLSQNLELNTCPEEGKGETAQRRPCDCESVMDFQTSVQDELHRLQGHYILWGHTPGRCQSLRQVTARLRAAERRLFSRHP